VEEHLLEAALRAEVMRQEKLEQFAAKFSQKVQLRNGYLEEMILVLSDPRYGSNLSNVEASLKKHEAISADIMSRCRCPQYFLCSSSLTILRNYIVFGYLVIWPKVSWPNVISPKVSWSHPFTSLSSIPN
jgi:hypothetical protein